ncbi:hypothetical protein [Novosphingobium rosa]|uniref:hypothetical protein n=1 Tax=Novosphingobium rosa TaxID=76978 RepID=UPI0008344952|nr:hypothetical protein [Novosphingobium rosa]
MMDDQAEDTIAVEPVANGVVLLFAEGQRPSVEVIDRLLGQLPAENMLSVSYRGEADRGRLELLCRGLTFDLKGLAPARGAAMPVVTQRLGLDDALPQLEGVLLASGQNLAGGAHLRPILCTHLQVGLALAALPGVQAVVWALSGVMMRPAHFVEAVGAWLAGGSFPVPGLVGFSRDEDGALFSHGLFFFAPRQVRVEALEGASDMQAEIASALVRRQVDGDSHVPAWIADSEGRIWNVSWDVESRLITARPGV